MDELKGVLIRAIDLLEQDNRGVQLGCYSVALVGLTVAIRRVRPFSKMRKPSDVPNRFIQERRELTGVVERIEPSKGGLLMINHKPLLPIPGLPEGSLPVKISGVRVSSLGLTWLHTVVSGHEVTFIPVATKPDFVKCEVFLPQMKKNKAEVLNIGETLVKIGFGYVANTDKGISNDRTYQTYCTRLEAAENYALRKKLGAKYYFKPAKAFLVGAAKAINNLLVASYKHVVQIPKMPAS